MKKNHTTHHKAVGNDYSTYNTNDSAYKAQKRLRTIESWKKQDRSARISSTIGVLKIVFFILLFLGALSVLKNDNIVTFNGLLEFLSNAPQIDLSFLDWSAVTLGDWGVFNWLRDFFNIFISLINVIVFVGTMAVQLVFYFIYFLNFIFL